MGRRHRKVTSRRWRALLMRDRHCAHPGCTSRSVLQAHHVRHWIKGGRTELENLVVLCERHHHALHDGEFEIESLGRQRFRYFRGDGQLLVACPDPSALLDRHWAVGVLAGCRATARAS